MQEGGEGGNYFLAYLQPSLCGIEREPPAFEVVRVPYITCNAFDFVLPSPIASSSRAVTR